MRGLAILLAACLTTVLGVGSAHAQYLQDPDLLTRYESLSDTTTETADVDAALEAFAADYLRAATSKDARCLFGCNSGFSGDAPDYEGPGLREFLAHADLASLATELGARDMAIHHLSEAHGLLSAQWKLHSNLKTSPEPADVKFDVLLNAGWMSKEGCSGIFRDPAELAGPLLMDVEKLKLQDSVTSAQLRELDTIERQLQEIRPLGG